MRLSEIRAAIRKMKGNPSVVVELTSGKPMTLVLQKTPTLETLGTAYASESGDIGLTLDEGTGIISGPLTPVLALDEAVTPVPEFEDGEGVIMDDEDML